jgi:hypothetical protein
MSEQRQRTVEGTERYYQIRERAVEKAQRFISKINNKRGGGLFGVITDKEIAHLLTSFALDEAKLAEDTKWVKDVIAGPEATKAEDPLHAAMQADSAETKRVKEADFQCFQKARAKGEPTFTLRAQDMTAPRVILYWMSLNCETLPNPKMADAGRIAFEMRHWPHRKLAD